MQGFGEKFLARLIPQVSPSICPLRSAYRQFHSTETVLLKIASDLFEAAESGFVTVLVALGLVGNLRHHRPPGTSAKARARVRRQWTGPQLGEVLSRSTLMVCQGR